ncbi:MAG: hypothetical protein HQ497_12405 [SAR86 cluster bacterium]|uniref:Uncharacterized protein n=1 Tax=SAR86 cluster bacterium TaxID=2030880 RepID=A0A972VXL5_9GAMM|nr:hypothetical protein [SAR86 cluster bacterium]
MEYQNATDYSGADCRLPTAGLAMVATWLNDEFSATIFGSAAWAQVGVMA